MRFLCSWGEGPIPYVVDPTMPQVPRTRGAPCHLLHSLSMCRSLCEKNHRPPWPFLLVCLISGLEMASGPVSTPRVPLSAGCLSLSGACGVPLCGASLCGVPLSVAHLCGVPLLLWGTSLAYLSVGYLSIVYVSLGCFSLCGVPVSGVPLCGAPSLGYLSLSRVPLSL